MKKRLVMAVVLASASAILAGTATTAQAFPSKSASCSSCHGGIVAGVSVRTALLSNNGRTASYRVTVSGGGGAKGWAVFSGSVNKARATASSGTFKVAVGRTYRVWGVVFGTGANYRTIRPSAPSAAPAPTSTPAPQPTAQPSPGATSTPGARRSLTIRIGSDDEGSRGDPLLLRGILRPAAVGDTVFVEIRKPGSSKWRRGSTRRVSAISGAWSYRFTPASFGVYRLRVRSLTGLSGASARSRVLTLRVRSERDD